MHPHWHMPDYDERRAFLEMTTDVEAALIALEHMQVQYMICGRGRLSKFRRNTISFPQDVAGFARRAGLMQG